MSNNPSNKKDALNRGIRSLLGSIDTELKNPTTGTLKSEVVSRNTSVSRILLTDIISKPETTAAGFRSKSNGRPGTVHAPA